MKRLYNIDSLKFLCAVLVVFLHVRAHYQEYILPLTRCAVPCFFIISGYLVFSDEILKMEGHLKRSIKKILWILLWSTVLFAAIRLLFAFKHSDFSFLSWRALGKFVFLNENPFSFHLWYISAYLYTLVIVLFMVLRGRLKWIYYAVPFLLLLDLCLGKYSLVLWHREFPFIWVRNFLCVGIPYFTIGMLIKRFRSRILDYPNLHILALGGGNFVFINFYHRKQVTCHSGYECHERPLSQFNISGCFIISFFSGHETDEGKFYLGTW